MHCKHCGAAMEELQNTCPACGATQTEEEMNFPAQQQDHLYEESLPDGDYDEYEEFEEYEDCEDPLQKKKMGRGKLLPLAALILVICFAIGFVVSIVANKDKSPYTGPMESDQYIVAEFGDHKLTNQTFMYYYWAQFYQLYDYYGSYLSYYLDLDTPFEDQQFDDDRTWADYFGEYAIQQWSYDMAMLDAAVSEGFTPTADQQDSLQEALDSLDSSGKDAGYTGGEDYLKHSFDLSSDVPSYSTYMTQSFTANSFASSKYDGFLAAGKADAGTHTDIRYINIRHILIKFADSTDASKAAAKAEAEALYDTFKKDPTKDNFSALAKEHSDDGSASAGGLIEDVYPGQMVENFDKWCFAEGRKENDHGLVESEYGWHLMFFDSFGDIYQTAAEGYADEQYTAWEESLIADLDVTKHPENITFRHAE